MSSPTTLLLNGDEWTVYPLGPGEWSRQRVWEQAPPEAERRVPIRVPGLVSSVAGSFPEIAPEACDWVFERTFTAPEQIAGGVARLRFDGIDDAAHVFLNGERIGSHTGQFSPAEWVVTDQIRPSAENRLLVVVEQAPELNVPPGAVSRQRRWKSRFAYGWPGFPRQVSVGLWDSVALEVTGPAWIRSAAIYTNLAIDRTEAALSIVCEFGAVRQVRTVLRTEITQEGFPAGSVEDQVRIFGDTGVVQSTTLPRVQLWWPNGHGRQPLYRARLSLLDLDGRLLDRREITFGVRHVEAVACQGAPPDSPPLCLTINGRPVWLKGWDWLPLRLNYAGLTAEDYEPLLRLARDSGANLLRVWGGGLQETEAFYDLCDRLGLMVWQEFPLAACGDETTPPGDAAYLRAADDQATAIIGKRRHHPGLVRWSGGSGLTSGPPDHEPLGSDHPALAELRAAVETEDPQRPWTPVTPSADPPSVPGAWEPPVVSGWLGLREHPRFYDASRSLFHTGFGIPVLADPTASGPLAERVRADVSAAFGKLPAADFPRASELLQALGLQYAVEADRRRQGRCAGTSPWSLNESWLAGISPAAVAHGGTPRAAFYAVKRAYRPFHVSAALRTFSWTDETVFQADVWLHNDGPERSLLNVVATVLDLQGRELYQENIAAEAPENASECVGDLYWRFPNGFAGAFYLCLEVIDEEGETLAINHYPLSRTPEPAFAPFLTAPATALEVVRTPEGISIRNSGTAVAVAVTVEAAGMIEDSGFPLAPGAVRVVAVGNPSGPVVVRAWNAPEQSTGVTTE